MKSPADNVDTTSDNRSVRKKRSGWNKVIDMILRSCHIGTASVLFGGLCLDSSLCPAGKLASADYRHRQRPHYLQHLQMPPLALPGKRPGGSTACQPALAGPCQAGNDDSGARNCAGSGSYRQPHACLHPPLVPGSSPHP